MGRVQGRVAIVTGAARGMGAAHAAALAREGAKVLLTDVLAAEGRQTASQLGPSCRFEAQDVSRAEDWDRVIETAEREFGPVSILVNNAGIGLAAPFEETTEAQYRRVIDVNQIGVFLGMRAVLPSMRRAGGGSIINISSVAGLGGDPLATAYAASKWAVTGMTKVVAKELGPEKIRVNSVHPGVIDTPMIQIESAKEALKLAAAATPLRRIAESDEVAKVVLFLASDEASFVTGAAIVVDGGFMR